MRNWEGPSGILRSKPHLTDENTEAAFTECSTGTKHRDMHSMASTHLVFTTPPAWYRYHPSEKEMKTARRQGIHPKSHMLGEPGPESGSSLHPGCSLHRLLCWDTAPDLPLMHRLSPGEVSPELLNLFQPPGDCPPFACRGFHLPRPRSALGCSQRLPSPAQPTGFCPRGLQKEV